MKKLSFSMILIALISSFITINAQNINVLYGFRTYKMQNTNYVEINTSIDALTLNCKQSNGNYYTKQAELTTIICNSKQADSAIYVDKRLINAPQKADCKDFEGNYLSDMQRIGLENGDYVVYFELKDVNSDNSLSYRDVIQVNYTDEIAVSDIMLIDNLQKTNQQNIYSKVGYDLYPYMNDIIDENNNIINYYAEIYNTDLTFKDKKFVIRTIIEDIANNKTVEGIEKLKVEKTKNIIPYLSSLDISSLYEGAYYLTVEVRNENNILYAYKRFPFFKKSKNKNTEIEYNAEIPVNSFVMQIPDSLLKENIRCLRPIVADMHNNYILYQLKNTTPAQDRYFLYTFYKTKNPINPDKAYEDYMQQVEFVNRKYSTKIKKGYDTDMGRVLLAYGTPNDIIDEKFNASSGFDYRSQIDQRLDVDAPHMDPKGVNYYPYQIWVYNHTPYGESNRKFVFYAKQDNLSEYFLLHSNAKGELQDMYWEHTLSYGTLESGVVGKAGRQFQKGHQ